MTMLRLQIQAEPYCSTGNIGENLNRLLGAPALSPLQTVIRESLQNIADAARLGQGPEILIRIRRLNYEQLACLRERILAERPAEPASCDQIATFLKSANPVVLEICDFRTTGLCGPTRADRIPLGTVQTDFISFLRNVGTPRDTDLGGGTYGFGKSSLYAFSRCRTILVDTLTCDEPSERRFMGCHIGHQFGLPDEDGMIRQFTGRHWWGVRSPDGVVDPVTGMDASALAILLGMPERREGMTGTSIMILDPLLEDEDLRTSGYRIVEGILWSFWPRLMRDAPAEKRFSCRVMVDGEDLEIPSPESFPPLSLFCRAMSAIRKGSGSDHRPIECLRPRKVLGTLAIEKDLRAPGRKLVAEDSLFDGGQPSCSIALMRPVGFVVKYLPGNQFPDSRFEWAGVFVASDDREVERAFALSEPPAHDDWIPGNLPKGPDRSFVNVALQRLAECAGSVGGLVSARPYPAEQMPALARIAGRLGAALAGLKGDGAGRVRPSAGVGRAGRRAVRRARATPPVFERLVRTEGGTVAIFSTEIRQDQARTGQRLRVKASVSLDGGMAGRIDPSIPAPEIVRILARDGSRRGESETIDINGAEGIYEIQVRIPQDTAVTVEAELETEGAD